MQINTFAQQKAQEYKEAMEQGLIEFDPKMTHEKMFLVSKFEATPESMLVQGMLSMGDFQECSRFFKKVALAVHPDKNSHPFAAKAFLKIRNA